MIVFEGIFALWDKRVNALMDLRLFVDTDDDVRLARRRALFYFTLLFILILSAVQRDIAERGRDLTGVLDQYERFVKPSFERYVHPTIKNADIIVPRGADNTGTNVLMALSVRKT